MSARHSEEKAIRRLRKALRQTPECWIDLVQWLKDRRHAQTTGEAKRLLLAGKVKVESHPVGRVTLKNGEHILSPYIGARFRKDIRFVH